MVKVKLIKVDYRWRTTVGENLQSENKQKGSIADESDPKVEPDLDVKQLPSYEKQFGFKLSSI